jgi:hypothetical protein
MDIIDARMKLNADAAIAASTLAGTKAPLVHTHPFTEVTGTIALAQIADNTITNAKLAAMTSNVLKGALIAGPPVDLSVAQVQSMLGITGTVGPHTHVIADVTGLSTSLSDIQTKEVQRAYSGSLTLADAGCMVTFSGAAAVTVPSGVFAAGHRIDLLNLSAGVVSFAGGTLRSFPASANKLAGQYAGATIWIINGTGPDYVLVGNIIV